MTDMPAMDRCPVGKDGRHALMALYVNDTEKAVETDLTLACCHCGAVRRVPLTGALYASRLDDADASQITAFVRDPQGWETR